MAKSPDEELAKDLRNEQIETELEWFKIRRTYDHNDPYGERAKNILKGAFRKDISRGTEWGSKLLAQCGKASMTADEMAERIFSDFITWVELKDAEWKSNAQSKWKTYLTSTLHLRRLPRNSLRRIVSLFGDKWIRLWILDP